VREDSNTACPAKPLRVYLVEDSPIIVGLLRGLLRAEPTLEIVGHATQAGLAAKEIVSLAPDVAIIDIALENSSGFEVLRNLSSRSERRPIVMVLSNFSSPRYRDEAAKQGANYFFDKNGEILNLVGAIVFIARQNSQTQ